MKLHEIERVSDLTPRDFKEHFLRKHRPCVFTDFTNGWAALNKWTPDFFKTKYGDLQVQVVSSSYSKPGKHYMTHDREMPFREFLESIEHGPTDLRLFLFDLIMLAPELRADFSFPNYQKWWLKKFPLMFFGGEGSEVTMHYDIDCANVFLTQFIGNKQVILFSPQQSKKLYQHPFTVKSLIDPKHADYEKFPALKHVEGYETILRHGETLFMPTRFWHYMRYLDFSFGLALRTQTNVFSATRGGVNMAAHYVIDKGFNAAIPKGWQNWKEKRAYANAKPFEV